MAVTSINMRISGSVTFDDGSKQSFESVYGDATTPHRDLISQHSATESVAAFEQLIASSLSSDVDEVLAFLPSAVTLTPDSPSESLTVTDATFFLTGQISEDDGTNSSFSVELFKDSIDHFPSETDDVWAKLADEFNSQVADTFDGVAGDGNSVVASS